MFNTNSVAARLVLVVIAGACCIAAQQPQAGPQGNGRGGAPAPNGRGGAPAPTWKTEEYLLLGDANRGAGEPMIAVDPTNPKNIVVDAMASLQQLPPELAGQNRNEISRSTITTLAVTHNGGITWKLGELPALYSPLQRCPDPTMDVTKDGIFLGGCEVITTVPGGNSGSVVMISLDKGESWGPRAETVGQTVSRFAPGIRPAIGHAAPFDRPFLAIDDSTGTIYGVAQGGTSVGPDGNSRSQSFITASTDGGKSFGTIYAWDSNGTDYRQTSRGIGEAAAFGEVAVIYGAANVPASERATCPCTVFGLSHDQAKTFTYHVLSPLPGAAQRLIADQTKAGRYSILRYVSAPTPHYEVTTTEDHGQTWSQPVNAGSTPEAASLTKPAIKYSHGGVLALIWRAIYQDGSYDVWGAISKNQGKTFSRPLRISHAKSPSQDPIRVGANDDFQDVAVDDANVHLVWADARAGFQGVFYGRAPFSVFDFPSN